MKRLLLRAAVMLFLLFVIPTSSCTSNLTAQDYNRQGTSLVSQGKYEDAVTAYTKAISLNSKEAQFYVNRGIAYINLKKFDLAIADFNKAIELDPKLAIAYANRGCAYASKGGIYINLAIADFNKTMELSKTPSITEYAKKMLESLTRTSPPLVVIPQPPPITDTPPVVTTPPKITGGTQQGTPLTSIYDGTYSGMFYYRLWELGYKPVSRNSNILEWDVLDESRPILRSLKVTVTFKTVYVEEEDPRPGVKHLYITVVRITNVICDDPDFGTGANGVAPVWKATGTIPYSSDSSMAFLPKYPAASQGEDRMWTIFIYFPNGSRIGATGIALSPDGKKLARSTIRYTGVGYHWSAENNTGAWRDITLSPPFEGKKYYVSFDYDDWYLEKVAP